MDHKTDTDSHPHAQVARSQRGFTLVELMIVVAIIAVLAAIIIPNYVHARAEAAVSETEANMKQIATAMELYYADNNAYPSGQTTVVPALFGGATNPYLTSTPENAITRVAYTYTTGAAAAAVAGGTVATYTVTDPAAYDATTLQALNNGPGGAAACGPTACTHIAYDPQDGLYGLP